MSLPTMKISSLLYNQSHVKISSPGHATTRLVLTSDLATLSDDFILDSDSSEPEVSFSVSRREQLTPPLKDAASTVKVCVCMYMGMVGYYHSDDSERKTQLDGIVQYKHSWTA